jgi:small subunit ribosomal protein S4
MPVRTPRLKIVRRLGTPLPGLTRKSADRRPAPPGQHGATGARRRRSAYARALEEKQKLRLNHGVTETQLRRYLERARGLAGETGTTLRILLERRLDNVVFRLRLARTIPAARQLVSHGHVLVNGARVDRPGFELSAGDLVALAPGAQERLARAATAGGLPVPGYLAVDDVTGAGRMVRLPEPGDLGLRVDAQMIVEFYAR